MNSHSGLLVRVAVCAVLAAVVGIWADASGTLSAFTSATVTNDPNTAATGTLGITNTYASTTCSAAPVTPAATTACTSSVYPASVPTTGSSVQTNSIKNTGTFSAAATTAKAQVMSCGPVQLANSVGSAPNGAMLPRNGTTFAPASGPAAGFGSVTLNGTSGYASSVASSSEPTGPALIGTAAYGLGIWFKTTSGSISPLFGFGSSALTGTASNDRILYLDANGKIGFIATTGGVSTPMSPGSYNNGQWHFAYVTISTAKIVLSLNYSVSVYVDGVSATTATSSLLGSLASYPGYWHAGWSPIGGTARYLAGSLSGFTVDDSGAAPTTIAANPTSYTSFDSTRTEQWPMNDSGGSFAPATSITGGTLPAATVLPGGDPCTYLDITWSGVLTKRTFAAAVTAGSITTIADPEPGATQTSTITVQRDSTFNAYASGLLIYAPLQTTYSVGNTPWTVSFVWNAPAAGTVAGSTFVIA